MSENEGRYRRNRKSDLRRTSLHNLINDEEETSLQRSGGYSRKRNVSSKRTSFETPADTSTPYKDTFNVTRSPFMKAFRSKIIEHLDTSTSSSSSSSHKHRHSKSSNAETSREKLFESSGESSSNSSSKTPPSRKFERRRDSSRSSYKRTNVTSDFEKLTSGDVYDERKRSKRLISREFSSDESSCSESDSETEEIVRVRGSYRHTKSKEEINLSAEATPGKRQRTDTSRHSSNRSYEMDRFHSSKDEEFYKHRMIDHRKFVQRASIKRFEEKTSMSSKRKTSSSFSDPKSSFLHSRFSSSSASLMEQRQRNGSAANHHRRGFSESWSTVTSSPRVAGRKRLSDGHLLTSSSRKQTWGSPSLFPREFKSRFYESLDGDQLASARGVLQQEMRSDVGYVDTHCHIDFLFKRLSFYDSMDEYMEQTFFKFPANFEGCIADWCQPSLYKQARSILDATNSKFKLWGAFGCHPHFVQEYNEVVEKKIEDHITQYENVIAWGEMGLDYSDRFGPTDHELQKRIFARQLQLACRRNLPLVIHCRDADPDLVKIMKKYVPHDTKIHRHCLTTEEKDVRPLLDHFPHCYVGFTNLLTNRNAYRPRDAVAKIPLNRVVLETDAPYFIPRCVTKESQALVKWSHPGMASSVACEIANIKNMELDEVLLSIRENVNRLYNI